MLVLRSISFLLCAFSAITCFKFNESTTWFIPTLLPFLTWIPSKFDLRQAVKAIRAGKVDGDDRSDDELEASDFAKDEKDKKDE